MENNTVSTVDVEMENLRDELPWRDLYPELPTVEASSAPKRPRLLGKGRRFFMNILDNIIKRTLLLLFPRGVLHRCPPAA